MKYLLAGIFTLVSLNIIAADSTFIINGQLKKIKSGKIYLSYYRNGSTVKDSANITKGIFKFKGNVTDPIQASLTFPNNRNDYFSFYLEPVRMKITGAGDSLKLLEISGSAVSADDKKLKQMLKPLSEAEEANGKLYSLAMKAKNTALIELLDELDLEVLKLKRGVITDFVKENPSSLRGAMAIRDNYSYYAEAEDMEPVYNLLTDSLKHTTLGESLKKMIDVYRTVAIGKTAPEFTQTTPEGKTMPLSATRGKYVLVDFWASWCGPCRRENPNVVKIYNQFKDNDFTIFGVSYDTKKDKWEKAIKDDNLTWAHVSDLQGWKNSTSDQYGIKAIPSNMILDKNGTIIAKNLFGKKLAEKVSQLMKNE